VWWQTEDEELARRFMRGYELDSPAPIVAFGVGAAKGWSRWPFYGELIRLLAAEWKFTPLILAGQGEEDLIEEILRSAPSAVVMKSLPLGAVAKVLSHCFLYIGNNSGPIHLAAGAGVPVVEISSHPRNGPRAHENHCGRFGACARRKIIVYPKTLAAECSEGCTRNSPHCIATIKPDEIAAETLRFARSLDQEPTVDPELPSISIVVPNYNGGATIERALRSLIDQDYPNLEILVVDGGSTDNSVEIIRKYEQHLAWWVSEKDNGQSHAINKGFIRAKGEIVNWLCSDDVLLPGALRTIARVFLENPTTDVVAGVARFQYENPRSERLEIPTEFKLKLMPCTNSIAQPACFFRNSLLTRHPAVDETLHYAMDFELWLYFREQGARFRFISEVLALAYFDGSNKSSMGGVKITVEQEAIYNRYVTERIPLTFWHRRLRYPLERIWHRRKGGLFGLIYYPYQCAIILLLSPFYGFRRVRWMNWVPFGN
jgi:glycosyltransferase involved in cell wall biosynthesis